MHHCEAGTTVSEFDGALDKADDSDGKKGVEAMEVDSDSDESVCLDTSLLHRSRLKKCFRSA